MYANGKQSAENTFALSLRAEQAIDFFRTQRKAKITFLYIKSVTQHIKYLN